jgi:hypothetical protein
MLARGYPVHIINAHHQRYHVNAAPPVITRALVFFELELELELERELFI